MLALLRHADPAIRADACRLARRGPEVITTLAELLDDLHRDVCIEAACALGRMGRAGGRAAAQTGAAPGSIPACDRGVPPVADEECIVLLGRIARASPDLAAAACDALAAIEAPLAARLLERLRE